MLYVVKVYYTCSMNIKSLSEDIAKERKLRVAADARLAKSHRADVSRLNDRIADSYANAFKKVSADGALLLDLHKEVDALTERVDDVAKKVKLMGNGVDLMEVTRDIGRRVGAVEQVIRSKQIELGAKPLEEFESFKKLLSRVTEQSDSMMFKVSSMAEDHENMRDLVVKIEAALLAKTPARSKWWQFWK